ncbi:hypothetical protein Poli38472_004577 [Pythium oligandrum]|uniref:Phosphatidylinositol-4-phosphate 5-kinase n=1 Tax=Pythium oligandrum TaxID=41045 RepID=A0A8K1CAP5_PYTOL|nr:hypothetical protein Poli38472_004577 [Pythium oligandrum]|eukprot:TMW59508.1 hypothetical protein Poli38472_004577 [Pythium oligandrum]
MASMGYDALTFHETTLLYMGTGVIGVVLYLLILLSYFHLPNIKAQHPAVDIVVWHVVSALMTCIGFVMAYCSVDPQVEVILSQRSCTLLAVYNQFWALASVLWYLMLTLDLFVALVNPWMGYACKSWAYHTIVWSVSVVMAFVVYQQRLDGVSSLNLCWIQRTEDPAAINRAQWICLFGFIIATFVISLAVLLFASFRFARRQLDVTYRSKRRVLLQYYRYLIIFGGYWGSCAALYYAEYLEHFHGPMARRIQLALGIVAGSYPVLFLFAWILNTELYQNRSSENSLTSAEREAENYGKTEHFSAALRKDLMRYTTAGIRCSINDDLGDMKSPVTSRSRVDSIASSIFSMDDGESAGLYSEKRRLATTVYNGEYRYYEKLGFTDYAPRIFQNIREACDLEDNVYEQSFAGTLLERASEGKSGMLFYFTSDRKYLVKTMTKREHSFLLKILPLYHQYILKQPNTLLCRILGCHSMQLPVGWNRMFFVVMENVFADGPVDERYDLKGIFHQSALTSQSRELEFRRRNHGQDVTMYECDDSGLDCDEIDFDDSTTGEASSPVRSRYEMHWRTEAQPLLPRTASRSSLRYDSDFVCRCAALQVNATTRANLLAQITNDCGFLQELGIMDYSFLLGIQKHATRVDPTVLGQLAHNAVVSEDQTKIYYLGFVDILQHYNFGWKVQHWVLSTILDKRKITALPPAEYALRFLGFIHSYLLSGWDSSTTRSYGSVDLSMLPGSLR